MTRPIDPYVSAHCLFAVTPEGHRRCVDGAALNCTCRCHASALSSPADASPVGVGGDNGEAKGETA